MPRAEFCCRPGFMWMQRKPWDTAAYWYRLAAAAPPAGDAMGFVNGDVSTWLPQIRLGVCCDRMGQHALAYAHHERARRYRPSGLQVLHNKRCLDTMRGIDPATP